MVWSILYFPLLQLDNLTSLIKRFLFSHFQTITTIVLSSRCVTVLATFTIINPVNDFVSLMLSH